MKVKPVLILILILTLLSCNFSKKPEKLPKTEQYEKLIGKWKVINSNFLPFEHISYCEKLELNSIFEFNEYGELKIYKNRTEKRNCNGNQKFWIDKNEIIVFESDFGFPYEILKLTSDSLKIKTERIPKYLYERMTIQNAIEFTNEKIEFIKENGIIITLEKTKNVG
ncbi:hypothetical protein MC378_14810 [Polaribacter sp. MSW13]|uniref:Lipocalin-like domain-containing protein n=1 Tax=Polaribacter marinus TaxID=2916838 RepID=A0A9X1VQJ8_9FLAO|nr:hypothetical protein [Polaribacter marinus]MCI2230448.1 hypothetical protein [Polaribacter marinus]